MSAVGILSYGVGNLRSVQRAFAKVGADVRLITTPDEVGETDKLVLPGVGAFKHCAQVLKDRGLWNPILDHLASDKPFFGICVGMQLMMDGSDEFGTHDGFGFVTGRVQRLPEQAGQKIPMVGWKSVAVQPNALFLEDDAQFYFVHSYAAQVADPMQVLATYPYGDATVTAAIGRGNKIGTQFHPEKSGEAGLALLERFVRC